MNENRSLMKIIINIKTRDKKNLTKKIHGGEGKISGDQFSGGNFFWGAIFSRSFFLGGVFPKTEKIRGC